jgi:hypothetical protein
MDTTLFRPIEVISHVKSHQIASASRLTVELADAIAFTQQTASVSQKLPFHEDNSLLELRPDADRSADQFDTSWYFGEGSGVNVREAAAER